MENDPSWFPFPSHLGMAHTGHNLYLGVNGVLSTPRMGKVSEVPSYPSLRLTHAIMALGQGRPTCL